MHAAVFLDRDGVLNQRRLTLVRRPEQLILLPGAAEAAARLSRAGYTIIIATNQEFVGHGYITRQHHEAIMTRIVDAIHQANGNVTAVYACTHPRGSNCDDRKPKPGMLLDAARDHHLDLSRSYMIGDNAKDMQAGRAAGTRTILVDPRLRTRLQRAHDHADHITRDLTTAAEWIVAQ